MATKKKPRGSEVEEVDPGLYAQKDDDDEHSEQTACDQGLQWCEWMVFVVLRSVLPHVTVDIPFQVLYGVLDRQLFTIVSFSWQKVGFSAALVDGVLGRELFAIVSFSWQKEGCSAALVDDPLTVGIDVVWCRKLFAIVSFFGCKEGCGATSVDDPFDVVPYHRNRRSPAPCRPRRPS